jgi:septal ring factor EnvC (AmiA/AmiB activator)
LVEKGSKVEEFLRAQDKEMQEAKAQVHELQLELSAATKRRTVGELQISQLRDQYNQNVELLSTRVCAYP